MSAEIASVNRRTRPEDLPEFLSVDEVATWLNAAKSSVYMAAADGRLTPVRFGRLIRIARAELLRFVSSEPTNIRPVAKRRGAIR
jgi:excisionase family DNA binding protein